MKSGHSLSLRARLSIMLISAAVLSCAAVGIGVLAFLRLNAGLDDQVDRFNPAAIAARDLLNAGVSQESGARGYLLSGSDEMLAPYRSGISAESSAVDRLREYLHDYPELVNKTQDVQRRLDDWRSAFAEPQISANRNGSKEVTLSTLQAGESQFQSFRTSQEDLVNSIFSERRSAQVELNKWQHRLGELLVAVVMALLTLGLVVWIFLRRLVLAPLDRLGKDVRVVADGQLDHPVGQIGVPELHRLSTSVEAMRVRIIQELDEVRAARTLLDEQATELARSNADLEQFAYVASHDLQEPLRKVASFCQLIEQRYRDQLDDRGVQYIDFAVDGAKRMQQLINDLLAFSRVGRSGVAQDVVSLHDCFARASATLEQSMSEANAVVEIESELPQVRGDATLLVALFQNLLGNAVKFRRPDLDPVVKVSASRQGEYWQICIADNGIGIEEQYAEKIFVIFQRLHSREQFEGTGIGLSLCKKIVEYHGGEIWLVSPEEGFGATICFLLPAVPANDYVSATAPAAAGRSD